MTAENKNETPSEIDSSTDKTEESGMTILEKGIIALLCIAPLVAIGKFISQYSEVSSAGESLGSLALSSIGTGIVAAISIVLTLFIILIFLD